MNGNQEIKSIFKAATGTAVPEGFGEPFATTFSLFHREKELEVIAAAYCCALFLSVLLNKFPAQRLHTFTHYIQENYGRFSFNCNMYEEIFASMEKETLDNVILLDHTGQPTHHKCMKEDIFEAFDFYTNR